MCGSFKPHESIWEVFLIAFFSITQLSTSMGQTNKRSSKHSRKIWIQIWVRRHKSQENKSHQNWVRVSNHIRAPETSLTLWLLCGSYMALTNLGLSSTSDVIWDMHKNAQKVEWKIQSKISCHYTWLLHGKNYPSRWHFLRSFLTASKPSRRSITAAKRTEREKKETQKKFQKSKSLKT